jgi:hypothetical protein
MIGKTINSILTGNIALTTLVAATKIYPYAANENTTLPAIIYRINSMTPIYDKGGWAKDEVEFSIQSYSNDYSNLQDIVKAIRTAFELKRTGYDTQEIGYIYLVSFEEDHILSSGSDIFGNKLTFKTTINKY